MATVTTTFSSEANLETAFSAANGSTGLASAVNLSVKAWDNLFAASAASFSANSYTLQSGTLTNGDIFSIRGSNLGTSSAIMTQIDYGFASTGVAVSQYGSITSPYTGYLDKVIVSSSNGGTVTLIVNDNVAFYSKNNIFGGSSHISSATIDFNGAQSTFSGSLNATTTTVGQLNSQTNISGTLSSASLAYAGQSIQVSNIDANFSSSSYFSYSPDVFFANILSGNDTVSGSTGNEYLVGYAGHDSLLSTPI